VAGRREQVDLAEVVDEERPRAGGVEARERPGVGALLDRQLKFRRTAPWVPFMLVSPKLSTNNNELNFVCNLKNCTAPRMV
jgi:U3 small nucleolar ribonucleoprotein component